MYLSPEAAMEGIGTGHSEQARIEFDGGYFYYTTVGETYADRAGELGDWIYWVTPVRQNEIGLWSASPDPRSRTVRIEGADDIVGALVSVEWEGKFHNFFLPECRDTGEGSIAFAPGLPTDCDRVTVEEHEVELFRHSYFVTDQTVTGFTLGGTRLLVEG